jgi:hypothetical protein
MSIHPNHRPVTGGSRLAQAIKAGFAAIALASAVTALGAIAGAGSASAVTAQPAAAAVSGVTWHPLTPVNGWHSGQAQYSTGGPAWAVQNGVVYLSGSVSESNGTDNELAVLPAAARPSKILFITVYTLDDTRGYLAIYPTGEIMAHSSPYSNAQGFTSLAGVSFPVAPAAAHKLALVNGWKPAQPKFGTGDPAYSVSGGVVHLSGSLYQPAGTNEIFAVLPRADRPAHFLYIQVMVYTPGTVALAGTVEIDPDGSVWAYSQAGTARQYTSLAGISYPLGSWPAHPPGKAGSISRAFPGPW